jgi:Icc-related predicted phosphoesterase
MTILFTSDLHGDLQAVERYARLLGTGEFDVGVIAGDIGDYNVTLREIGETPGVQEDDLLEELYDPEDTVEDLEHRVNEYRADPDTPLAKNVRFKEDTIKEILRGSKKHVILVAGNHDLSDWKNRGRIHNVHGARFTLGGFAFVGYRYTRLEKSEDAEEKDLPRIERLIRRNTILVTHAPAYGVLDMTHRGIHMGSRPLSRLSERKEVLLHLFGHVHHSFGLEGKSANGSYEHSRRFISIHVETRTVVIRDPALEMP